ncbi:MAG: hypothetical protein OER56_00595 [Hyphomicrobiales bacterium]|nr:hypothetical protein [Hyphomicrobiales bacterium]
MHDAATLYSLVAATGLEPSSKPLALLFFFFFAPQGLQIANASGALMLATVTTTAKPPAMVIAIGTAAAVESS